MTSVLPWNNKICSTCPNVYYAICPFNGIPQPHCAKMIERYMESVHDAEEDERKNT